MVYINNIVLNPTNIYYYLLLMSNTYRVTWSHTIWHPSAKNPHPHAVAICTQQWGLPDVPKAQKRLPERKLFHLNLMATWAKLFRRGGLSTSSGYVFNNVGCKENSWSDYLPQNLDATRVKRETQLHLGINRTLRVGNLCVGIICIYSKLVF